MAIKADSAPRCCFVISCRISHFGKNPDVGGSPPKAIRVTIIDAASVGVFNHEIESLFVFVEFRVINIKNREEVNTR